MLDWILATTWAQRVILVVMLAVTVLVIRDLWEQFDRRQR